MKRLLFALTSAAALWVSACGGGSNIQPPPPTGKYSLSSLSGQYAFTTSGEVFTSGASTPVSLVRVGSFVADGKGNITAGMEDINTDGMPSNAIPIDGTKSSYTVNADGRGVLTLNFQSGSTVDFGIVLTSTSDGLLIDETSNANQASTGSGNFILQQSAPFALSELTGNYVFDFAGLDGQAQPCPCPESFIGQFTVDSAGAITGFFDDNDNGNLSSGGMNPGAISQDPGNISTFSNFGRGIATIANQNFVFYIVNSNHVRFLSTNNGSLSGDAILQTSPPPASPGADFAFIAAGSSIASNNGLTRVGRFTVTGSALSKMLMDTNDAASFNTNNLSNGSITSYDATTGRGQLSFQDSNNTYAFVFYLSSSSSGVIQDVSPSGSANMARVIADGSIVAQTGGPFSSSNITGTYALNWSGQVVAGGSFPIEDEEDLVAQATVSSLALSGTDDIFQFTSSTLTPQFDLALGGSITIGGDGTGGDPNGSRNTMSVIYNRNGNITVDCVVYFVSPQLAFFANNKNTGTQRVIAGVLKAQQ
jgi:hypothetical protein